MLKVVQEVVQTLIGQLLVHQETSVVYRLVSGVETLQWLRTKMDSQVTGIAIAALVSLLSVHQVLHS